MTHGHHHGYGGGAIAGTIFGLLLLAAFFALLYWLCVVEQRDGNCNAVDDIVACLARFYASCAVGVILPILNPPTATHLNTQHPQQLFRARQADWRNGDCSPSSGAMGTTV